MATATTQRLKSSQSSSIISSSDNCPTVVLCSSKNDHLLSQDICMLCGSLGKDDEGNLIACSQCGQCYHPYCVNIKGLKVVVSKGWRCLDCTVCEACGQPGDEGKLLLCDECELSYHTYCLNPPLEDVPPGAWKCHWCVVCQKCQSHSPGINSDWQKNYTECGPCASKATCPECHLDYNLDDLILKCTNCSRWLHAQCDSIYDKDECELAIELGYKCLLCRPPDEVPLYMVQRKSVHYKSKHNSANPNEGEPINKDALKINQINLKLKTSDVHQSGVSVDSLRPQSAPLSVSTEFSNPIKRPASSLHFTQSDLTNENDENLINSNTVDSAIKKSPSDPMEDLVQGLHMVDGVYLSEVGLAYIKSQKIEPTKRQRAKRGTKVQKLEESINTEDINKDDDEENKSLDKLDEDGKKKRVRKLSKAGVGGFSVRQRGVRVNKEDDFNYSLSNDAIEFSTPTPPHQVSREQNGETSSLSNIKPKRIRKKPKKKTNLLDQYPSYLQEAFFGKSLLSNEFKHNEDKVNEPNDCSNIDLKSRDVNKINKEDSTSENQNRLNIKLSDIKNENLSESMDSQLLNKEGDLIDVFIGDSRATDDSSENKKDFDLLGTDFNLDMVDPLDSKVVEDLLNGLGSTQQSTQSHPTNDSSISTAQNQISSPSLRSISETSMHYEHSPQQMMPPQTPSPRMQFNRPQTQQQHAMLQTPKIRPSMDPSRMQGADPYSMPPSTPRPMSIPQRSPFSPQSPYPQHPIVANPSTPPVTPRTPVEQPSYHNNHLMISTPQTLQQPLQYSEAPHISQATIQYQQQPQQQLRPTQQQAQFSNQQPPRMETPKQNPTQDWESEEALGDRATKSAVLYANIEHPGLKNQFRSAEERFKQIQKLWRQLAADKRKPYVEKARENRSASKVAKPAPDPNVGPKKSVSPLMTQTRVSINQDSIPMPPQPMPINQNHVMNQAQDTRWKQPMPVDGQPARFAQSSQQQPHQMISDTVMPQPISPAIRPIVETHFVDPSTPQVIPAQVSSPQMQFVRPPMQQQHSMMQAPRARQPNQVVDPYSIPPNTPRPMSQQRSPFSPQSPFPPHTVVTASSTPPVTPRTPTDHTSMFQTNQHLPMINNNQPQIVQQPYVEQSAQPMQQANQYPQMRQSQYQNQTRMIGQMSVQQFNSTVSGQPMRGPMNPQLRSQQSVYQQQYRQAQPVRYVSQHQDSHQHTNSPLQQNMSPQHMQSQRVQRPVLTAQQHQTAAPQRMTNQPRPMQQPMISGQASMQQMQPLQNSHVGPQNQHHIQAPAQLQPQVHQPPQHQQQMALHPAPMHQQGHQQIHYSSVPVPSRIDSDDPAQLLDDEDALKDLGADFNILEFADPEPDQGGASTSSGKNNIDLDPEFEDFFDDRDTLEDKRSSEPQTTMTIHQQTPQTQQQSQAQPQVIYQSHMHQQTSQQQPQLQPQHHHQQQMPQNQAFIDNQTQQAGAMMPHHVQYASQRQPQFSNQQQPQRAMGQTVQQYATNQTQIMRGQPTHVNQGMRVQHPPQHQVGYTQSRPQQPQRYQTPVNHDMHPQQHLHNQQMTQNHMGHQSQSNIQRGAPQVVSQPQYSQPPGFAEASQQPGGQMHPHQHQHQHHHQATQQPMQYSQVAQPTMSYASQPQQNSQYSQPRRHFQPMPQQHQQHHQGYGYQQQQIQPQQQMPQQQQGYQSMTVNQQMMKNPNDMMLPDKNPIIGDPITSMEFTMYESGSGANNEAANVFESNEPSNTDQEGQSSTEDLNLTVQGLVDVTREISSQLGESINGRDQQVEPTNNSDFEDANLMDPESAVKFVSTNSERISSCSDPSEVDANSSGSSNQNHILDSRTSSNSQGQNQLLKQLLATCPAADGPNQDRSNNSASTNESVNKVTINATNHTTVAKQVPSGIPTISFPMDSTTKTTSPSSALVQTPSIMPTTARTTTSSSIGFTSRPLITSTGTAPSSNFEIKTYNVGQPTHNNISGTPTVLRVSHIPTAVSSATVIRPSVAEQTNSGKQKVDLSGTQQQESCTKPSIDIPSPSLILNSDEKLTIDGQTSAAKAVSKISAAKQRKSDYMAKRRADLEKEPTPPPREIKPKKRVRGPNKRSRAQLDGEDTKMVGNTSHSGAQLVNGTPNAPPRKRVRKSQKVKNDNDLMLSSLALKLRNDLPSLALAEPCVRANNNINTLFACGDLNSKVSKLRGQFGRTVPVIGSLCERSHTCGRRKIIGYYHEEFPKELSNKPIDSLSDRLIPRMLERECDSPCSIISASASDQELSDVCDDAIEKNIEEGGIPNELYTPDLNSFRYTNKISNPGLISKDNEKIDINNNARAMSPSIPIHVRLPVVSEPLELLAVQARSNDDNNKENFRNSTQRLDTDAPQDSTSINSTCDQTSTSLNMRLKEHGNVSLTMTLTNEEADGVKRVLSKLPNLMDNAERSSGTNSNCMVVDPKDCKTNLSGSLRLLTGTSSSQAMAGEAEHSDLKFDELNYVPMVTEDMNTSSVLNQTGAEQTDVKPEICYHCRAVVIDRGIRKTIGDLTDNANLLNATALTSSGPEYVFCSVDCYGSNLMSTSNANSDRSKNVSTDSQPQMSDGNRRKWDGIHYTRWTPSYFEPTKSISPMNEEIKESVIIDSSTFTPTSSSQLLNQADSSVDSNESDNSTSYSQSTSGKLANSLDSPFNNTNDTPSNYLTSSTIANHVKDAIPPWPEGMDLIQVKPFKSAKIYSKTELNDNESSEKSIETYEDVRRCVLCHELGDGDSDGPARLLNFFIDGWVHLNCALWSLDVYELANGALINVELACRKAMTCSLCRKPGATLKCFKPRCPNYYHFLCALKERCSFYEDKSVQCRQHSNTSAKELTSFIVKRRVYINRDEQAQVAEMIQSEQHYVMRVGSLVFLNIGQLLPQQLAAFHDQNNIYPAGYKVIRYYWSYRRFNKRCKYLCNIEDNEGRPIFRVIAQELGHEDEEFIGQTPEKVWRTIIDRIVELRKKVPDTITTFPVYIRGVDLFGLNEPSIVRILESLPGVETLTDYEFKFGRSPLLELPLAINPTGCARSEPKLRTHFKRPYTIQTASNVTKSRLQSLNSGDSSSPYIKQFVHSKSSQYRKMKSEWRNNVVLARSRVQGLGLYAARDIEKHTMVIEYIGMLIRNEIAERYERIHEANNRGIYMFRLDEDRVIDATLAGGLARYINHSCNPNCVAEAVEIDRERKILIIANRKILKGEELGYDYKLAIEDDQHKISCLCGASTCKKWMN